MTHERRYRDQVDRIRAQVRATIPKAARVLVISRGDEALLRLDGRQGGHFPQTPTGLYAGHYPSDDREAVAHLKQLREEGAEYLVIPAEAGWWLEHYPALRAALEEEGELLPSDSQTALIYALTRSEPSPTGLPAELEPACTAPPVSSLLRALLPDRAGVVLIGLAADSIEVDDRPCWRLPAEPAGPVIEQARAACAAGARFVVLLHPDKPSEALDGRYRPAFAESMKLICGQRLADVFEVLHA
ncbi:MAG TPA: hypothetical protein VIY71_05405 [Solirubrobacterales bacterium]